MSSIWNGATAGASPFATIGMAPAPGGGRAAKMQSVLQSVRTAAPQPMIGPRPAPGASAAAGALPGGVRPMDSSSGGGDTGISANDFLTLLVTEMQNQDPTADTDPNEYINQLVQINSLEQLISINQNLATVLGAATSPVSTTAGGDGAHGASAKTALAGVAPSKATVAKSSSTSGAASGNLTIPASSAASRTVAHALDGHARPALLRNGQARHAIRDIPTRSMP